MIFFMLQQRVQIKPWGQAASCAVLSGGGRGEWSCLQAGCPPEPLPGAAHQGLELRAALASWQRCPRSVPPPDPALAAAGPRPALHSTALPGTALPAAPRALLPSRRQEWLQQRCSSGLVSNSNSKITIRELFTSEKCGRTRSFIVLRSSFEAIDPLFAAQLLFLCVLEAPGQVPPGKCYSTASVCCHCPAKAPTWVPYFLCLILGSPCWLPGAHL